MPVKKYESKAWLTREFTVKRRSPEDIAKDAGCSTATLYRKLHEFELIKK